MNEITVTELHTTVGLIYKLTFLSHAVSAKMYVNLSFCNLATCVKLGGFEWNQRWPTQTCFTVLKTHILQADCHKFQMNSFKQHNI